MTHGTIKDIVERLRKQAGWHIDNQKMVTGPLLDEAADEIERLRLRKRPVAWVRYVCGTSQFQHASDAGDPPEDEGWIALYRRGE
jgi:hypothetical protein